MHRTSSLFFSIALLFATQTTQSQQASAWDPAIETGDVRLSSVDFQKPSTMLTLNDLTSFLTSSYSKLGKSVNKTSLNLYIDALTKIELSQSVIQKDPQSTEAIQTFQACSLLTEAAVLQMIVLYNQKRASILQDSISLVLDEMNKINKRIATVQSSEKTRLLQELNTEKILAQQSRHDAEAKFAELRSSLIQVTNDARGTIISMSDILFESAKATLTNELQKNLAKIAGILLVFKKSKVAIEGHTDNQGSDEYNKRLSQQRADNVLRFLTTQGIDKERLSATGFGFAKPIAENATKEGRQKNRRVDLIVQEIQTK